MGGITDAIRGKRAPSMRKGLLLLSVGYIAMGLVFLIFPNLELVDICYALGMILMVLGAVQIAWYLIRKMYLQPENFGFSAGIAQVLLGLFAVLKAADFAFGFAQVLAICMIADSNRQGPVRHGPAALWRQAVVSLPCCRGAHRRPGHGGAHQPLPRGCDPLPLYLQRAHRRRGGQPGVHAAALPGGQAVPRQHPTTTKSEEELPMDTRVELQLRLIRARRTPLERSIQGAPEALVDSCRAYYAFMDELLADMLADPAAYRMNPGALEAHLKGGPTTWRSASSPARPSACAPRPRTALAPTPAFCSCWASRGSWRGGCACPPGLGGGAPAL